MGKDLRTFMKQALETMPGSIKVVEEEVDPRFGITGVAAKFAERNEYPAILCKKVKGSDIPVVINLTATFERLALALDTDPKNMVHVYGNRQANPVAPIEVSRDKAPVKEIIWTGEDADLSRLPIPTHNGLDGGPYITGGFLVARDPETGLQNIGLYRHQVQGPQQLGVWFIDTHHGAYIHRSYDKMDKPMPVAIAIGHHPCVVMGSISRLRGMGGEYEEASALLQEPVELVRAETSDLLVPASAEIIIEGEVVPHVRTEEGPFAEWPGHYIADGNKPIIKVKAITMRKDAIYYDVFAANREHVVLGGLPRMGSIYREVKRVVPGIQGVNVPAHSRMHCYVSISKVADAEVKKAAFAALNTEPDNLKMIIVVDDDINVFNDGEVLWAVGTRFDATREGDLTVIEKWSGPGGLLPPGWIFKADGSKEERMIGAVIIDATKPAPPVQYPPRARVPQEVVDQVDISNVTDLTKLPFETE